MDTCKMVKSGLSTVVFLFGTQTRGIRQWVFPLQPDALHNHPHGATRRGLLNGRKQAFVAVYGALR